MAYLHCEFQYNTAIVKNVFDTVETPSENIDFVTGDVTLTDRYASEYYDYGTANGTTLTVAAAADSKVLTITDSTGMSESERVSVELDNGLRHLTYIETVDSGTQITIADGLSSAAAISNNVVVSSQLEGTTDGTLEEDFKFTKAVDIQSHTLNLMQYGYSYKGHRFLLVGDTEPAIRMQTLLTQFRTDRVSSNLTITNVSQSNPAIVTVASMEDVISLDTILVTGVGGMTEINNGLYVVGKISGLTFELNTFPASQSIDTTGFTAYTSGGTVIKQEASAFQPMLDSDGHLYTIVDNDDFLDISQAAFGRRNYIFGVSGQTGLLAQVSLAVNTQAAMDAIVDNR